MFGILNNQNFLHKIIQFINRVLLQLNGIVKENLYLLVRWIGQ